MFWVKCAAQSRGRFNQVGYFGEQIRIVRDDATHLRSQALDLIGDGRIARLWVKQDALAGKEIVVFLRRTDGLFLGLPPAYWLTASDPQNTGVLLAKNIALLQPSLEAPEATQASLGFTQKLGDTGLYVDLDGIWVEGDNEILIRDVNFGGKR